MLAGLKPGEKFLFAVVIIFILGLISQFLGAFLASLFYDFRVSDILSMGAFDDPEYVAASKLIQIIGSVGTFIVPALLFSFLFEGELLSLYRFRDPVSWLAVFFAVGMMVSVIPLINYLAEVNMRMDFPIHSIESHHASAIFAHLQSAPSHPAKNLYRSAGNTYNSALKNPQNHLSWGW